MWTAGQVQWAPRELEGGRCREGHVPKSKKPILSVGVERKKLVFGLSDGV